jgi:hypothetical protein
MFVLPIHRINSRVITPVVGFNSPSIWENKIWRGVGKDRTEYERGTYLGTDF